MLASRRGIHVPAWDALWSSGFPSLFAQLAALRKAAVPTHLLGAYLAPEQHFRLPF